MSFPTVETGQFKNITSTGNVTAAPSSPTDVTGYLLGFYVNSTTAGTIFFKSGGSGGTAMGAAMTPAIGFHRFPATFQHPLHATIANTLDVTVFWTV